MLPTFRRCLPVSARAKITAISLSLILLSHFIIIPSVWANNTAQVPNPPFSQNWTNTGLITADDNWSNVPGIVGFLGDYTSSSPTGVDPQTLLQDMTTVDVIANQTNPNTLANGGVAEFDGIANPTIALNGSGTADAPNVIFYLNTTGLQNINVAYDLRDLDGSVDDAVQQVALQYRVGSSGNFTNVPAGYVNDATTGPSLATKVTSINVTLPAAVNNQPVVQVRVMTTNAAGNDEWVGIDNIVLSGTVISNSTNPSGTGNASPSSVSGGDTTLLTVAVTPGTNPTSTAHTVTANLSSIGGSATQQFFDNGTNGDVTANDNTFSYSATVANGTSGGAKSLPVTITETAPQSRTGSTTISLTVLAPSNPSGTGTANPNSVLAGESSLLTVSVTPGANPTSTGLGVAADLSSIGGSSSQMFSGSGNTFTYTATVAPGTTAGLKTLPVQITDAQGRSASTSISLTVQSPPPPVDHVVISQVYGGGGNSSATYTNDYVELYNPTTTAFSLTGWTLQYASATGNSWTNKQPLGGSIGPGEYYLVSLASGGAVGDPLPVTPNISGDINMSATAGKITLVSNSDSLVGSCPIGDPDLVDFVGYGTTANCREGSANAPAPANNKADFRKANGLQDTNQNGDDFVAQTPLPRRTAPVVELGPWVASTDPTTNGFNAPRDASMTVNFSEPVTVDAGWYNISCPSGLHNDATVAGGGKSYVITPNTNFTAGEQCTVTINKSAIHDEDLDDSGSDTDTLFSDYTWSFTVATGTAPPYPPSVHLTMGNPNGATTDITKPDNYLMEKPEFTLSYNRDRGGPNWVSWHLSDEWVGTLTRVDTFRPDPQVPPDWYRVQASDFFSTGFDRGHMTPNADRDKETSSPINQATFLMSNMLAQAPGNNQGPWAAMENYLRTLLPANELYIVAGGAGTGGTGSNGGVTTTVANGHVTVPAQTWKVVLVLPKDAGDDVARVTAATRTIAVIMPNQDSIRNNDWQNYLTSVDAVEQLTGYDFFSNVPDAIENSIEAGVNGVNPPGTTGQTVTTGEGTPVAIHLTAVSPNNNTLTYTIINQPTHGTLTGGTGADRTYTPASGYIGSDSFTFRASDGQSNSNISTVTINVTEINSAPVANADDKSTQEDVQLSFPASDLTLNDSVGDANDAGQTLTVTSVTGNGDTHGTVNLESGQVTYTPAANYHGAASFNYEVCDNGTTNGSPDSKCATGIVNVNVESVNDGPVANDDSATTDEDTPITIDVVANDTDIDGDTLTLASVADPVGGTVAIDSGKAVFTPTANYHGTGSFTYTVSDGHGGTASASVNVTINSVNDNPSAVDDSASTNEDTPVTIDVRANDTDVDGDTLSVSAITQGAHGTVTTDGTSVSYSPNANFFGTDTFTYTVSDGHGGTASASVTVTVNSVNDNPVAGADSASTNEDTLVSITVLSNDTDADGDTLSVSAITQGAHGTVTTDGTSVSYTPAANFFGTDTFTYTISDGHGGSDTATVTITVNSVNDPPTAVDDSATVAEDSSASAIDVLANDSFAPDTDETLTITGKTDGAHGTVTITGGGTGLTYTPAANFFGTDTFTYTISDGHGGTASASVNVTINSVNDNPVAGADSASTNEDTPVSIDVRANDTDIDGDTLSVSAVTQGAHGTVTTDGTSVSYSPAANFFGTDTFTYTVSDGHGGTDTATVTVTVTSVNDAPDAVNDAATVAEDSGSNNIAVLANDTDVDGDAKTVTAVTQGAHGTVAITGGGASVSYTPAANYNGPDSFTYTISDGNGGTDTATVTVTVTAVNDAPVASGESYVTDSNTTLNVAAPGVLANDTDIDGDALSAQLVTNVSHGTLALNANGSFTYTPTSNFTGTDSFTYRANDGTANSNIVTVTITVNDKVAPTLNASVAINLLWPPNGNLVNVGLAVSATDNSGGPATTQVFVFSNQDDLPLDGSGDSPDAKDIAPGTLRLRAERGGEGRVYLILVVATDSSGNTSRKCVTVVVPKSNSQQSHDDVNQQAQAASAYCDATGTPPVGYFVVGDGPIVGSKQ